MATAAETAVREARQFIGGQWVDAADGATFEDRDPYTGDVVATVPAGGAEDARRAIERRERRVPRLVGVAAGRAAAHLPQGGRRPREPPATRSSRCSRARPARTFGFGMFQMHFVPGLFRQAAGVGYAADRPGHPVGQSRHVRDGRAQAGRRRRRDRAVERGADPLGALDRRAARARQHRRAQAVRVVARRPAACSGARSSPRPGCPTAC